jgi:hypothetical protein
VRVSEPLKPNTDHNSRAGSERAAYERMRQHGVPKDVAQRVSREASVVQHRSYDKKNGG